MMRRSAPRVVPGGRLAIMAGAIALSLLCTAPGGAFEHPNKPGMDADQVKAGFLFNFARFVEWPSPAAGPLVICVVGDDAFVEILQRVVGGRTVDGRAVAARRLRDDEDPKGCHELFLAAGWRGRTTDLLQRARGPVLTVGESVQFLREGGIIRFHVEDNRVRFQISRENAASAGLKVSSHLLSLGSK